MNVNKYVKFKMLVDSEYIKFKNIGSHFLEVSMLNSKDIK